MSKIPSAQQNLDYRKLFKALPALYWVTTPDFKIVDVSDAFLEATFKQRKEVLDKQISEVFPPGQDDKFYPEISKALRRSIGNVIKRHEPYTITAKRYDIRKPDGTTEEKYWTITSTPILNDKDELVQILNLSIDVTRQQLAEQAKQRNQELFEYVAKATNDVIWDWNLITDELWWNEGFTKTFGYSEDTIKPDVTSWTDYIHPEDREAVVTSIHSAIENDDKWTHEYRFKCANGSYADILDRGFVIHTKQGEPVRMIGAMLNITKEKKVEREKERQAEQIRSLLDTLPQFAWTISTGNDAVYFNRHMYEYTGATLEQLSDWNQLAELIYPEDREETFSAWASAKEKNEVLQVEHRWRRYDGEYRWRLTRIVPVLNEQREPVLWVGTSTEIEDQKRVQEKLQEKDKYLQRVLRQAPVHFGVVRGQEHVVEFITPNFERLFGGRITAGCKVADSLPEITKQGFVDILDNVYHTGEHFYGDEYPVEIDRENNGQLQLGYFNITFQPLRNDAGAVDGVLVLAVEVTDQVLAKRDAEKLTEQLQASQRKIVQVMDALPIMTWTAKPNGEVDYYNQRWYEFTGSDFDEMQAKGWGKYIHPDDLKITREKWEQSITTGAVFEAENRWKFKSSDNYSWFLARGVPIRNKEGEITMWVGSHTDINSYKLFQQELEHAKNRLEFLAESIPQIVWSADPSGNVDYFNQRWYDFTKMSVDETLGFGWAPAVHPEDLERTNQNWLQSMKTGETYEIELRLRDINTEDYRWFLARAMPMRNKDGIILKWYGTCTDIHVQKELQGELLRSKEQFEFLAESIPQLVWTTKPDGYHDYFNHRWTEFTGFLPEQSYGEKFWAELLHPEDQDRARARWRYSLETGDFYEIEYRFKGKDGMYRWFLAQAMPMRNKRGKITKWFGTCTDIQDQLEVRESLERKNDELKRINDDLDNFVYTASHDLKLPIINMAGIFEELCRTTRFEDPEADELIKMFHGALEQIQITIQDLSEVVKVKKNSLERQEDVNLSDLTDEITLSIQDMIDSTSARVSCDFSRLPELRFSRSNLKSVLYNLITNAIKYRSPERAPEVSVKSYLEKEYAVIAVADNGLGINLEKHQNKLFQMFRRFHRHESGTGLGLYLVNRIAKGQGGRVEVSSTENEGTEFRVYFLLKPEKTPRYETA